LQQAKTNFKFEIAINCSSIKWNDVDINEDYYSSLIILSVYLATIGVQHAAPLNQNSKP